MGIHKSPIGAVDDNTVAGLPKWAVFVVPPNLYRLFYLSPSFKEGIFYCSPSKIMNSERANNPDEYGKILEENFAIAYESG